MLQQNKIIKVIKKNLVKKCLELFGTIKENKDDFVKFYEQFGKNIKLGIHEDSGNKEKLSDLLMFYSTKSGDNMVTFKEYIENMHESQKSIYYITGESKKAVENSPFIEKCKKRNYEVLYLTDPIDEYCVQQLKEFDGKSLVCVTKEGLKFDESEEEQKCWEELMKEFEPLTTKIKSILGSNVEKVVLSERVVDSPCVLVTGEFGWSANMERIMKAQALRNNQMDNFMTSKKIMELNMEHIIVRTLKEKSVIAEEKTACLDVIKLLYDNALLASGFVLEDAIEYSKKVNKMIQIGFCEEEVDTIPVVESEATEEPVDEESKMEEVD